MSAIHILWIILLVVTVLVLPLIIVFLHKVLHAAWNIEQYMKEMRDAGLGISQNTCHIGVLNSTIHTATHILDNVGNIDEHSATLGGALKTRAEQK